MKNLVLITSVINTPNTPNISLNNILPRSIYTREERFKHTKETIISIKKFIPNPIILLVECSDFTDEEYMYFYSNCDYILNLWDNLSLHSSIFGLSKSLGEGTMTIEALKLIIKHNLQFDNLFKISGRYYLTTNFNYGNYNNNNNVFKKIDDNLENILTVFYKIPFNNINTLLNFLLLHINDMKNFIGYEILFGLFINELNNINFIDTIGIEGFVSVSKDEYFKG